MPLARKQLQAYLQDLLAVNTIKDYCPNGLQVEGCQTISRIICGVSASQALIEQAITHKADAMLVHHGYFWQGESQPIVGVKKQRIATLLQHNMNLFAYHLPLDVHPTLGNNVQLAKLMNWQIEGELASTVGLVGTLQHSMSVASLQTQLSERLNFNTLAIGAADKPLKRIAWCTGAAQKYLEQAIDANVDAFISGEISEPIVHLAQESGVAYFAAGHHATECGGIRALGEHLQQQFQLECQFIDLPIPV